MHVRTLCVGVKSKTLEFGRKVFKQSQEIEIGNKERFLIEASIRCSVRPHISMKQSCTNVQPGSGQTKRALVVDKDEARCWPRALPVVEKRKTRCWPRAIPNAQLCCSTELGARGKPKIRCGSAQETCQGVASRRVGGIAETMRWGARRRRRHPRPNQNYKRGGGG